MVLSSFGCEQVVTGGNGRLWVVSSGYGVVTVGFGWLQVVMSGYMRQLGGYHW